MKKNDVDTITAKTFALSRIMRRRMFAMKHATGFNPMQVHALLWIAENPGMTLKELSEHLRVSPPSASVFVQRLVRMKLLRRTIDRKNRRAIRLVVTPAGLHMCRQTMREGQRVFRKIFALLPSNDRRTLARIVTRLVDRLEKSELHS